MGGKHNQAQRTKNNARPSNSGRSAQLLATSHHLTNFAALQVAKETSPNFATRISGLTLIGKMEDVDSTLDPNFQVVLKKMCKKDMTTKLKALQEFGDLMKSCDLDVAKSVLPFWPRIYNKLSMDSEHRVRDAAQNAHCQVVTKVKRNLAPYLKQLIGQWFVSQYDTFYSAADAATNAFQNTFPGEKMTEAVRFCRADIIKHIHENVIVQSDAPTTTDETDSKAKYERLLILNLNGFAHYLDHIVIDDDVGDDAKREKFRETLEWKLIATDKFWSLAQSDSVNVRHAWYVLLGAILNRAPQLLTVDDRLATEACKCVFGRFDVEMSNFVLKPLWECVLLIVNKIENWYSYVDVRKQLLPKLWKILKCGANGHSAVVHPNILPLVSQLAPHLVDDDEDVDSPGRFYDQLFDNLRAGLMNKKFVGLNSQIKAVLGAFFECLQYVTSRTMKKENTKNRTDEAKNGEETELQTKTIDKERGERLMRRHVFPLIEWSLDDREVPHKEVFRRLAAIVRFWSRRTDGEEADGSCYAELFWSHLDATIDKLLFDLERFKVDDKVEEHQKAEEHDGHVPQHQQKVKDLVYEKLDNFAARNGEIFVVLKQPPSERRYAQQVTFGSDAAVGKGYISLPRPSFSNRPQLPPTSSSITVTAASQPRDDAYYKACLKRTLNRACKRCVAYVDAATATSRYEHARRMIDHLKSVVRTFDDEAEEQDDYSLCSISYERSLKVWLQDARLVNESVVDLIFLLLKRATKDDKKEEIMRDLVAVDDVKLSRIVIAYLLSDPYKNDQLLVDWLKRRPILDRLDATITETMLGSRDAAQLLKKAVTETRDTDGRTLLSAQTLDRLIHAVCDTFTNLMSTKDGEYLDGRRVEKIDSLVSFVAYFAAIAYQTDAFVDVSPHPTENLRLIVLLFTIIAHFTDENHEAEDLDVPAISCDTMWEVLTSMQDAVCTIIANDEPHGGKRIDLTAKLCDVVTERFRSQPMRVKRFDRLKAAVLGYLRAIVKSCSSTECGDTMERFIVNDRFRDLRRRVVAVCSASEYVDGNMIAYDGSDVVDESLTLTEEEALEFLDRMLFAFVVVASCDFNEEEVAESELQDRRTMEQELFVKRLNDPETFVLEAIRDTCCIDVLLRLSNSKLRWILHAYRDLDVDIRQVFQSKAIDTNRLRARVLHLLDSEKGASLWSHVVHHLYVVYGYGDVDLATGYRDIDDHLNDPLARKQLFQTVFGSGLLKSTDFDRVTIDDVAIKLRYRLRVTKEGTTDGVEEQDDGSAVESYLADVFKCCEDAKSTLKGRFVNVDFSDASARTVTEIVRLLSCVVDRYGRRMDDKLWDLTVVSLCSWSTLMNRSKHDLHRSANATAFATAVCRLFANITRYLSDLRNKTITGKQSSPSTSGAAVATNTTTKSREDAGDDADSDAVAARNADDRLDEWDNLLGRSVNVDVIDVFTHFADQSNAAAAAVGQSRRNTFLDVKLDVAVGICLPHVDCRSLFESSADRYRRMIQRCLKALTRVDSLVWQINAYKMLMAMVPGLVAVDLRSVESNKPHADGLTLEHLKPTLIDTEEAVRAFLSMDSARSEDANAESHCNRRRLLRPHDEYFGRTFAHLAVWDVVLTMCDRATRELCHQYTDWLSKSDQLLIGMLNNVLRLIPSDVVAAAGGTSKAAAWKFRDHVVVEVDRDLPTTAADNHPIELLSCWLFAAAMARFPAVVRRWWNDATEARVKHTIERLTVAYVTPLLAVDEMKEITMNEKRFKNMTIKVHPTVREIVAVYTVEDAQMELVITLPANYPLGGPVIECVRQIGGMSHKQWLMQLRKCVLHQNGRIWDGLILWNNNLDKKFEGVDECYICFGILHPATYQLPRLCCQKCKKKFHSACLYKWFSTSNNSTCPICRSLF